MADKTTEKIKKSEQESVTQITAGGSIAAAYAYGTSGLELLGQLDSVLTSLANIDLDSAPGCKTKELSTAEQIAATKDKILECLPPAASAIVKAGEEQSLESITNAIVQTIGALLNAQSQFPSCLEAQFRKFLSTVPIQYYLLVLLSNIAKDLKTPLITENKIVDQCGKETIEKLSTFENSLPQLELPLIPELPYINIPSFAGIVKKIIHELLCTQFCVVTNSIIQTIAPALVDFGDSFNDFLSDETETGTALPLVKIPIDPYITEQAITQARVNGFVSAGSNEEVRDYINEIQAKDDIGQEEFIFLFLGKGNCNILSKIKKLSTSKKLGLNSDEKIINFFSFLGSFVNFIDLIDASRREVCPPDPCDLGDDLTDSIIASITDLCAFLNPQLGLPPLPLGAILDATGVNDFIVDSSYVSYKSIADLNGIDAPVPNRSEPKAPSYVVPYAQDFILNCYDLIQKNNLQSNQTIKTMPIKFISNVVPFTYLQIDTDPQISLFGTKNLTGTPYDSNDVSEFKQPGSTPFTGPFTFGTASSKKKKATKVDVNTFYRFTKPMIKEQLKNLQKDSTVGSSSEDDMIEFVEIKQNLGI